MVMPRETIARVCHDPYIPRGEDYDYVINVAMAGIFWRFCPTMRIVHLPPDSTGSQAADTASKLLADIRRFIYMREKMRLHAERFPDERFDPDYLLP
jgi:GT2 family glycosyltransferase